MLIALFGRWRVLIGVLNECDKFLGLYLLFVFFGLKEVLLGNSGGGMSESLRR